MLKKPIIYNRFALALVLALSTIFSLITSSVTHATSAYDTTLDPVSNIQLHNSACTADPSDTIDYSNNWVDQFISNSSTLSYGGSAMTKTQAVNLFNAKTFWGVSQLETSTQKQIYIWWTDSATAPITFSTDVTPGGSLPVAGVQKGSGGTFAFLVIVLDGGTSCTPRIAGSDYTTSSYYFRVAYDDADAPVVGFTFKPWRQFAPVTYPSGYAGVQLNKPLSGGVSCTNVPGTSIASVLINTSNSQDGPAKITYNSTIDGVDYNYYLTDPSDVYHITVLCGNTTDYGPTVENTVNSTLYWTCSDDDNSCYSS